MCVWPISKDRLGIPRIESDDTFLATVLPIENLPLARVLIRLRNRPLQKRHRTARSREQMSLWPAGYPKTPGFDVRFGSKADILGGLCDVRFTPKSGHRSAPSRYCPLNLSIHASGTWCGAWVASKSDMRPK